MKNLMLAALLAVAVVGCGESKKPESTAWIGGQVSGTPTFVLPGPVYALQSAADQNAQSGRAWWVEKSQWKPKGWSLWIASNVYSDYKAPHNDLSYLRKGFSRALSAADRSEQESRFIGGVSKWFKANDVDVEINFLGYDSIPASLASTQRVEKGYWLSFDNDPCEKAFRLCVSNYFMSPAARLPGSNLLTFKEWISPYLTLSTGDRGVGQKQVIDSMGGMADNSSPFYDYWPTMVFLVNPKGQVVRAWLPQKADYASVRAVEGAVVTDIGGKYKDLPVSNENLTASPPTAGYYGEYFIEANVGKVLDVFKEIMESK